LYNVYTSIETFHSVTVEFVGRSRAHWTEDRISHVEKTIFVHHRYPILGNLYSITLSRDENNCVYKRSSVIGDDTIYIPYGEIHTSTSILVSIYDEDDENIGQVLLDLNALHENALECHSFQLPIKCKTFSGTLVYEAFLSQSMFQQQPMKNTSNVIVLRVLSLELQTIKKSFLGPTVKIFFQKSDSNEENKVNDVVLPSDHVSFRFWFPTELIFPGSSYLKYSDSDFAHLDYYIFGKIDHGDVFDPIIEYPVSILPYLPLPQVPLLHPVSHHSENVSIIEKNGKLSGNIKCQLILDRAIYAPGEDIITCGSNVINFSKHNAVVKVNLNRTMELGSRSKCSKVRTQTFTLYEGLCNPLSSLELAGVSVKVPAVAPSFFGIPIGSTQPFTFTYFISLEAIVPDNTSCSSEIPVLISALPPKRKYLSLYSSKCPNHVLLDIESLALRNETQSDLVYSKTRVEEGDIIVPGIDHHHSIYDVMENSVSENRGMNHFKPSVLISLSRSKVTPSHESQATHHLNHDAALVEIMKSLENEIDSHGAISDWIKEHPKIVDDLSTEELTRILDNLKSQVYIPCVAREIALHSNKLTVSHVRKITNAFPAFKSQVVKAMLPYVIDRQNCDDIFNIL